MPSRNIRTAAALAALLVAAPAFAQPPTMESLWPNDDGRSWRYEQHYESYFDIPEVVDNQLRIFFDGTTVAAGGVEAQYLRQQLVSGSVANELLAATIPDPLLRAVWVARPDLRGRIAEVMADAPCPESRAPGAYSLLLNGDFAWLRTAAEVAAWRCNLANTRSWLWLVSDLTIGNTFTLQLVPDLADNVFLHGTIAAIEPATVPAGTFDDCVRVDYRVDYGMSDCTDASGGTTGSGRSETRGWVRYAPGVGPVESFEQFLPLVEGSGTCGGAAVGEVASMVTMRLHSQPVPVLTTSWGRLKAAYR